jgi:peptidoglycan/LPS O-acetylase OafA/YrhL
MSSPHLPIIQWQRQSQLDSNSAHSLLISLMRGLAALQVAAAHLRAEMFPGLSEVANPPLYYQMLALATGFAHQAVVVFFLISGWLVGGSLLNKLGQPGALGAYAIDRATRLWTVLVPALCLMLAIGAVTGAVNLGQADFSAANEYSAASFAGNLLGLQTVAVQVFSGNYALWSLANETWYYIQFPLLLIVFTGRTRLRQLGAASVLLLLGAAAAYGVYFRFKGDSPDVGVDTFVPYLVYSLPLLAFLSSMQRPLDLASPWIRRLSPVAHLLSEFSFTLYVIHVPIIKLLRYVGMREFGRERLSVTAPLDYAIYFGMLLALLLAAYLSYRLFESHTFRIRRVVKAALQPARQRPAMAPASAE